MAFFSQQGLKTVRESFGSNDTITDRNSCRYRCGTTGMIPVAIAILLGAVLPVLLPVQMVFSAIVVAVSSASRTMMDRMNDALGQDSAQPTGAVRR